MISAAAQYGSPIPPNYEQNFTDDLDSSDAEHSIMMSLADHAVGTIVGELTQEADTVVTASGIPPRDAALIQRAFESYDLLVPASEVGSLANILNAGWLAYNDVSLWRDKAEVKDDRSHIMIRVSDNHFSRK